MSYISELVKKDQQIAICNAKVLALEARINEFDNMHNETIKERDEARQEVARLKRKLQYLGLDSEAYWLGD